VEKLRKKLCKRGFEAVGITIVFLVLVFSPDINAIVTDEPISRGTIYVDDDADPSWYDATHVKIIKEGINNASSGDTSDDEPDYYAVVIGVEKFIEIDDLPEDKLDDGAIDIYNLLIKSKNWEKENIKLLLNENATKDSIRDSIVNWLDERETENDVVVYYFSGHSLKMPLSKRYKGHAYSCPYDITDFQYSEDKITDIELDSWLDELDSKHVTLILDTCYSGKMTSLCQKNRVILTAGGKHFFCGVDESDALGNGIFTFFLLQGFNGIADINNDGWVSAEEAYRYARLPTIISSIWEEFPFIQEWNNKTILWFFQIPRMYDRYPGSIQLVQYQYD